MQHYWICDFMYSDTEWLVKIHICHKSKSNVPDVYQTCNIYLLSMNKTYSGDSSFCACSSPVPNWSCRQNARKRYVDNFCLEILIIMIRVDIFKGCHQFYDSGQIGMGTECGMPPPRTKKRLNSNQVRTSCILSDNVNYS